MNKGASDKQKRAEKMASDALAESISGLKASVEYQDLGSFEWLPEDFAERLMGIAWARRDDIESGSFKRQVKAYLKGIAEKADES
jgi:hypothetical protein